MFVIRPVREDDLEPLVKLAELTTFGLTTLPKDRDLLRRRIRDARHAFQRVEEDRPGSESYLFVMERPGVGIVGTCGMVAKVGGFEPFYTYRLETSVHESKMLGVRKEIQVLHLLAEHDGPAEIGSLFLHPEHRGGGVGRALSLSRFLFIAEFPRFFDDEVIAELRGVIDQEGRSPFWDALGRHFFDIEFAKADALSIVNKEFIGELMPRYPIYVPILPQEAQEVIGQVHQNTRPARRLLESEGFAFCDMVDIFEAGPVLRCMRDEIRSVRESRRAEVVAITDEPPVDEETGPDYLISNARRVFRCTMGKLRRSEDGVGVVLPAELAELLEVGISDPVRFVTLRPQDFQSATR